MNRHTTRFAAGRHLVAALLAIAAHGPALAQPAGPEPVRLTLLGDRYVVGAARFDDLPAVASWVSARGGRVAAIDACSTATTRMLLAAVERFAPAGGQAIEVRALPTAAPDCTPGADGLARRATPAIPNDEYAATDAAGRSVIP
jgi:hypothetical protein